MEHLEQKKRKKDKGGNCLPVKTSGPAASQYWGKVAPKREGEERKLWFCPRTGSSCLKPSTASWWDSGRGRQAGGEAPGPGFQAPHSFPDSSPWSRGSLRSPGPPKGEPQQPRSHQVWYEPSTTFPLIFHCYPQTFPPPPVKVSICLFIREKDDLITPSLFHLFAH